MNRLLRLAIAMSMVGAGGVALAAAQDATAGARARVNQAPVNLSGTWVPDSPRYGSTFAIEQTDTIIKMTFGGTPPKVASYNLDGSDSKNDGHLDAVFWNANRLIVVRDNDNRMRTEYEVVNGQLRVTVGGKYVAYNKK
jgi:hypothetical protein